MLARLSQVVRGTHQERGFTLIELVVVAAVLALLVALALPSYLGARNKAAQDEANGMAQEWRSLAYGCYLQQLNNYTSMCDTDALIGFNEQEGKYWNWTAVATGTSPADAYSTQQTATGSELVVSWGSLNAGLENGATFVVTMFVSGTLQGQSQTSCVAC